MCISLIVMQIKIERVLLSIKHVILFKIYRELLYVYSSFNILLAPDSVMCLLSSVNHIILIPNWTKDCYESGFTNLLSCVVTIQRFKKLNLKIKQCILSPVLPFIVHLILRPINYPLVKNINRLLILILTIIISKIDQPNR